MTQDILTCNEFSPTMIPLGFSPDIAQSNEEITVGWVFMAAQVTIVHPRSTQPVIRSKGLSLKDYVSSISSDPATKERLQKARKAVSLFAKNETSGRETLASLRLKAGLSQAELASLIGATQPYVARLERGTSDFRSSTIRKLASALSVSVETIVNLNDHEETDKESEKNT